MGRRPARPNAIPRLRARRQKSGKTFYYYDHGGSPRKEEPLGSDYGRAIQRWAELERESVAVVQAIITFKFVADRYRAEVIPTKAARTQRDNHAELDKLLAFFNDPPAPLDAIEPVHVWKYLDWRKEAPIRATREKALLSHLWNWARKKGYTRLPNPCAGVEGTKAGRDVYVEQAQYDAIWERACVPLRDAMDLLYLTAQRPGDVLRMSEADVREGVLEVRQGKTGAKVRIAVVGELAKVLDRIKARKHGHAVYNTRLVVNEHGRSIGLSALQHRFQKAREKASADPNLQLRDLRAKAATDKAEAAGHATTAQRQLGHSSVTTTEGYIRNRRGAKVEPTR